MTTRISRFGHFLGLGTKPEPDAEAKAAEAAAAAAAKKAEEDKEKEKAKAAAESEDDGEDAESEDEPKSKAKKKGSDGDDNDDTDEDMRGKGERAQARDAERERIETIITCPAAARNPELALSLALETRLSRGEAVKVLNSAPEAAKAPEPKSAKTAYEIFMERNASDATPIVQSGADAGKDVDDASTDAGFEALGKRVAAKRNPRPTN